jgi:hypothetical protein
MSDDAAGHLLHNIFAAPSEPGPPYTHTFDLSSPDPADAVEWLRKRISERLYLAQRTIEIGNAAEWTELSSGVLMTVAPDAPQDGWDGVHPMGDSSLTRLMEANDPQDTIARCEAELAILDEHGLYDVNDEAYCRICGDCPQVAYPCHTVSLLAAAYRHREGYARYWGTLPTHTLTEAPGE